MEKVLVIAFDGLDHDLIQEYGCEALQQQEFGQIDNDTGITKRVTSELFASFITGETHEDHGVTGLNKFENERLNTIEDRFGGLLPMKKTKGLRYSLYAAINSIGGGKKRTYRSEDLKATTLFEEIPGAISLNVPAYDRNAWIDMGPAAILEKHGIEAVERHLEAEHEHRKRELFEQLGKHPAPLLMAHFHYPDTIQDIFHKFGEEQEEDGRIPDTYERMDRLAETIIEEADGYDTIIFMSDHGLPDQTEHNKRAFYSCNRELFPDRIPHITDFHDRILELIGPTEPLDGVDV